LIGHDLVKSSKRTIFKMKNLMKVNFLNLMKLAIEVCCF